MEFQEPPFKAQSGEARRRRGTEPWGLGICPEATAEPHSGTSLVSSRSCAGQFTHRNDGMGRKEASFGILGS